MTKEIEKKVKKFWEEKIRIYLPDDEEKWEDLPKKEKKEIYEIYKKKMMDNYFKDPNTIIYYDPYGPGSTTEFPNYNIIEGDKK